MVASLECQSSTWLWYAIQGDPIKLDRNMYPLFQRRDGTFVLPDWVCRMPDDGLHQRMEFRRLDVHVAHPPNKREEFASVEYSVKIVRLDWFGLFQSALNPTHYILGDVILDGVVGANWKTIVTRHTPRLRRQKENVQPPCPVCGDDQMSYHLAGKYWLDERDRSDDKLMVTPSGIFLRQDVVDECQIPVPSGAFRRPSKLRFERPK